MMKVGIDHEDIHDINLIAFFNESTYIFCTLVVCCIDKGLLLLIFTDSINIVLKGKMLLCGAEMDQVFGSTRAGYPVSERAIHIPG